MAIDTSRTPTIGKAPVKAPKFHRTSDPVKAIARNAATTGNSPAAAQTVANQRAIAAVSRIAGRTGRTVSRLSKGADTRSAFLYGSVAAGAADRQTNQAEATASAAKTTLKGDLGATKTRAKGAVDVLNIIKAGEGLASAGMAREKSDARYAQSVEQAQLATAASRDAYAAALQFKYWKKQQLFLQGLEDKSAGGMQGASVAADTAADAAAWMRNYLAQHPGTNAAQLGTAYAQTFNVDPNAAPMLGMLANSVASSVDPVTGLTRDGYDRSDEIRDVQQAVHTLYPNFGKNAQAINASIKAALEAGYAATSSTATTDTLAQHLVDAGPGADYQAAIVAEFMNQQNPGSGDKLVARVNQLQKESVPGSASQRTGNPGGYDLSQAAFDAANKHGGVGSTSADGSVTANDGTRWDKYGNQIS